MATRSGIDDYYDVWVELLTRTSRPRFRALLLDRAGVRLEPELAQCLVTVQLHEPVGVLELADLVEQNHPKVSRSLARLEQLGLVARAEGGHDRRVKTASVTAAGRRTVAAINRGRRRLLEEVLADWSEQDRADLARLTRRLAEGMAQQMEVADQARAPDSGAP